MEAETEQQIPETSTDNVILITYDPVTQTATSKTQDGEIIEISQLTDGTLFAGLTDLGINVADASLEQDTELGETTAEQYDDEEVAKPSPQPDLTKPISVSNETIVVIGGKKCVLRLDPDSGEMAAFPVLPPPGQKRRGRPRKEEHLKKEQVKGDTASDDDNEDEKEADTDGAVTERDASAVQGLLELSNTGPDGVRRSKRKRKVPTKTEYTTLEQASDFEPSSGDEATADEEEQDDHVLEDDTEEKKIIKKPPTVTVKRGRGRPRRYPRESDDQQLSLIVPTSNGGQTILFSSVPPSAGTQDSDETETSKAVSSVEQSIVITQITPKPAPVQPIQPSPLATPIKLGLRTRESDLEKLKCAKCDFQAFYTEQYQDHISSHDDITFKCKCCHFVAFMDQELNEHFRTNHPRCYCEQCGFMAEHAYMVKRHKMRHSEEGCICNICGKRYKDQYIMKMHVKMVHLPAEVLYECNVCMKKFTRKAHLKRHMRIHEPEKPYKCSLCEYRGCERSDITKHLLIHEEPKFSCHVCLKTFRHIKNKELHMKRHKGQRDYKCGVCEFYGYTFTDIRKHIERKHSDVRNITTLPVGPDVQLQMANEIETLKDEQPMSDLSMIEQALASSSNTVSDGGEISAGTTHFTMAGGAQVNIIEEGFNHQGISLTADQLVNSQISVSATGQVITVTDTGGVIVTQGDVGNQFVYEEGVELAVDGNGMTSEEVEGIIQQAETLEQTETEDVLDADNTKVVLANEDIIVTMEDA